MDPITFTPLYMQRVWGGRELERVYGRELPDQNYPYGEAWEIVDREKEQSIVESGPFIGKSLHELWTHHREEIFGSGYSQHPRRTCRIAEWRTENGNVVHRRLQQRRETLCRS